KDDAEITIPEGSYEVRDINELLKRAILRSHRDALETVDIVLLHGDNSNNSNYNYTLPCESFLYVEGRLTVKKKNDLTPTTLVNNCVAFMFDEIRYVMCNYAGKELFADIIYTVDIKKEKGVTLQILIDFEFLKWETINDNCKEYNGIVLKKKTVFKSTLSVLEIQLNLYTFVNGASKKIINNQINAVPTSTVTIIKKKYKLISSIFHEGEGMNRGHYTCMLRADKKSEWCYCNDLQVIKKKWLKGVQEAYMLFLDQIK
ncbi:hypothetical protein ALC57_13825, partial [Trachymyrmex cornetzi]